MKNLIIATLALCLFSSCDDFLDEKLKGEFNSENIFSNAEQSEMAVTGIYQSATWCINLWKIGDVASDDAIKGGADGDQSEVEYIDDFSANSDNGVLLDIWTSVYETIAQANNVIAYVPNIPMSETLRNRLIAEAKFFRAFSYFNLVNIYGEVPLKLLPPTTQAAIHVPLSSVSAVYSRIESDLTEAAPALLPSYSGKDAGRVTQGAAYGLLAKAQLYQGKYAECLSSIERLDASASYDLVKNYSDLFKMGSADSVETVFAFRFLSDVIPGLGNALNQWLAPHSENGYYFDAPTDSYVNAFTEKTITGEDDPRLDASIGRDGKPWLNGNVFDATWSTTGYLVKKHNQPLSEVEKGRKADGGLPYLYMRYADVLLMKAEALNESHQPQLAAPELNRVRERAGLAGVEGKSENELREIIRLERRRELGFEFHRFFDLMRWGKEAAQEALGSALPWAEPRFYFPIPQSETDSNTAID